MANMSRLPFLSFCLLFTFFANASAGSCKEAKLCCTGRDSSCVVQRAPLNTIVEELVDKPCYCDHACLKLGDCCPDFKEACGVVDCQVSSWGLWSQCDSQCGPGSMSRSRKIIHPAEHGGRRCPGLLQRRACQGTECAKHAATALRETAMLLPVSLSHSRKINETQDIRKNLRMRIPDDPENNPHKEYCVEFEVLKASKACRKDIEYKYLQEGERICVRCETDALRKSLHWRCQGHGVPSRTTRFSALSDPHCHGKWFRITPDILDNNSIYHSNHLNSTFDENDNILSSGNTCAGVSCVKNGAKFIFV